MKLYRVIVSFEVEAEDETKACHQAQDLISDGSLMVEAIVELPVNENSTFIVSEAYRTDPDSAP